MDMMNQRLIERTQGLLHTASQARLAPSAPSFRAGWALALAAWFNPEIPDLEEAVQQHMNPERSVGTPARSGSPSTTANSPQG